jgi:TRAP transporter TAXI family solute receptor
MSRRDPALRRSQNPPMSAGRRRLLIAGGILLLVALGWSLVAVIRPAIQHTIIITTGADKGIYQGFADRYAAILKRDGINLEIRSSSGSIENYERLKNPDSAYEVGFIQSGTVSPSDTDGLQTIAAVAYEPIWVFYRGAARMDRLSQLQGKKVSIGVPGSGLLEVSRILLAHSGITAANTTLLQMDANAAYQGLKDGQVDAAFFIGRPDAEMQQTLLNSDLKLMSFAQADALVQKFPSLSKIVFPRASTSIVNDLPQADVTLLAAKALLVSKDTMHPALVYLLLEAAKTVHGGEDYFTPLGTFPNLNTNEFPVSEESTRFFKSGRPFLQRYLPFWLASFVERRLLILLPSWPCYWACCRPCRVSRSRGSKAGSWSGIGRSRRWKMKSGEASGRRGTRLRSGARKSSRSMRTPVRYGCRSAIFRMSTPSSRLSPWCETGFCTWPER